MVIKQKDNFTWFSGTGCHYQSVGCEADGKEHCTCKYHITDGEKQYSFMDYASAETKWCELTGDSKFILGKTQWSNS